MTLRKALRGGLVGLAAVGALSILGLSVSPDLRAQASRIIYLADGLGNRITSTAEGAFRPLDVRLIDPATDAAVAYAPSATIGSAPPTQGSYTTGLGSGATGGLVVPLTVCDSTGWLDMTSATTTEIVPLVASRTIRVCNIIAVANGSTTLTFKRGTGTNCGTGTTSVSPAIELTAQTGWQEGGGMGEVLGPSTATGVGGVMTSGNALCVTSSGAVNLHVKVRFAVY